MSLKSELKHFPQALQNRSEAHDGFYNPIMSRQLLFRDTIMSAKKNNEVLMVSRSFPTYCTWFSVWIHSNSWILMYFVRKSVFWSYFSHDTIAKSCRGVIKTLKIESMESLNTPRYSVYCPTPSELRKRFHWKSKLSVNWKFRSREVFEFAL